MKLSHGFTRPGATLVTLVAMIASFARRRDCSVSLKSHISVRERESAFDREP
jgi:multidrug transporter EmrE-like cation transporter